MGALLSSLALRDGRIGPIAVGHGGKTGAFEERSPRPRVPKQGGARVHATDLEELQSFASVLSFEQSRAASEQGGQYEQAVLVDEPRLNDRPSQLCAAQHGDVFAWLSLHRLHDVGRCALCEGRVRSLEQSGLQSATNWDVSRLIQTATGSMLRRST